ncbi:DarT ssDNA thymidine ADP-ribosyltransferase family protein [Morganella psychrotolerans]|uniref:DarT ssDNA thymidine ADP-ribosyltransferase family protein n=1 Tax=Morganella psychrotolerans TaxID=368603 RepID=UPI0039AF8D10
MSQTIQQIVEQRGIQRLIHFTRVENLASIMLHGIVPIANAPQQQINPIINDEGRWDGQRSASCLTITHPNHHMFYGLRLDNPQTDWVVLLLHPQLLWTMPCAFCTTNAANGTVSSLSLAQRQTSAAFSAIFDDTQNPSTRLNQRLRDFDTTDVQAEVLVFGTINPKLIFAAAFNKQAVKTQYEGLLPGRNVQLNDYGGGFFASRSFVR